MEDMILIESVDAFEILDSRGNPTLKVIVYLEDGSKGEAAVPSGASTGSHEALELRDGDGTRYSGKGVLKAVNHVKGEIADAIVGLPATNQRLIDQTLCRLDGTENKNRLGANSILGTSLAVCRAAAQYLGINLYQYIGGACAASIPMPQANILNGGVHADNSLDFQEFMVIPVGASTFNEATRYIAEVFHSLKSVLKKKGLSTGQGDEGGFAPELKSAEEAIELIISAIENAGFKAGNDLAIGIDAAASELFEDGKYVLKGEGVTLDASKLIDRYKSWVNSYPVVSIEDGVAEDDWEAWKVLTSQIGKRVDLVGDDLFVTNPKRIAQGIQLKVANAVLIKVNQIGTLSETIDAIDLSRSAGYNVIVSHRSGETEDSFISDLAVAMGAGAVKIGAPSRSERVAKYNRLIEIERTLNGAAKLSNPYARYIS
jgi:enolase